jgi:two-component system, OmpR family, osmolarity sensor histidine kinase EnvZ
MNKLIQGLSGAGAHHAGRVESSRFDLADLLECAGCRCGPAMVMARSAMRDRGRPAGSAANRVQPDRERAALRWRHRRSNWLLECADKLARVIVRDAGSARGIPDDQLEKVFRPFYRLEASRSQATGGTGLGLAIVRQLAETNGWKVSSCATARPAGWRRRWRFPASCSSGRRHKRAVAPQYAELR